MGQPGEAGRGAYGEMDGWGKRFYSWLESRLAKLSRKQASIGNIAGLAFPT